MEKNKIKELTFHYTGYQEAQQIKFWDDKREYGNSLSDIIKNWELSLELIS